MAFEYQNLKGKIISVYGSQGKFAEALGVSEQTVSRKMNSVVSFSHDDIVEWSKLLGIDISEIGDYFFA